MHQRETLRVCLFASIQISTFQVQVTRSRRTSSILLRFCQTEYCASPFCHPLAGFQYCNHGDVAFPQGERIKGVGRTQASMVRLPLLKFVAVLRVQFDDNENTIQLRAQRERCVSSSCAYLTLIRIFSILFLSSSPKCYSCSFPTIINKTEEVTD